MTGSLSFSAPRPHPTPLDSSSKLPPAPPDFLSTPQGELSFFRSIVSHRLVGPEKHFHLLGVVREIRNHAGKEVGISQVWEKYKEVYDEEVLETTWADQELTAIERDGLERKDSSFNQLEPPILDSDELENLELSTKPFSRIFPQTDFSLDPEEFLVTTAFERGQRSEVDPPDSPAEAPLKEIFYEPDEEDSPESGRGGGGTTESTVPATEEKKRSPRKRIATPKAAANAAAAVASPAKKKRTRQVATEEASGSELSDLTDEEEEEEEQDDGEEEEESPEETAGEDADSYLEEGTAASQNGEEDEDEEEEEAEPTRSRKRKPAAGRRASGTTKRTRNARSASVATGDSRTAAERKKDQSAATPSSRARGRASAGNGTVKRSGRPTKKK